MSWTADTDSLLADGGVTVTVKNNAVTHTEYSVLPVNTETTIETATVQIFPKSGGFKKMVKGEVKYSTHLIFFPASSSVAVDNRVYESGDSYYHEVMDVRKYSGHLQVYTSKVEGR
jgi:hypothetical protein